MMLKIFLIIFIFFFGFISSIRSQTVLLQVDRAIDSIPATRGPNLNKFTHFFVSGGFIAGENKTGAEINYGTSIELGAGVRWKYKIGNVYSLGYEWKVNYCEYKLRQKTGKL